MRFCFLAFLAVFAALPALAQDAGPVTATNWQRHPRIVEIREIYKEIQEGTDKKRLKKEQADYDYCRPYVDTQRAIYRDGKRAQRYYSKGGSGDSRVDRNFYYDGKGVLRFAFITGGAVNGTHIQHRIYFDHAGKRIWEIQKLVAGPGYTFPRKWPEALMVREPNKTFRSKNPCPVKAGG